MHIDLHELIKQSGTIAVIGMSASAYKPSHSVPMYFYQSGWNIIPINPNAKSILNFRVYSSLKEVPETIDLLNVFRPSEEALGIVEQAIERKNEKGDIKAIWFQEGIASQEAKKLAEEHGFIYVEDKCMYKEY